MQKTITYSPVGEVTLSKTRRSTRIVLSVRPNGSVRLSFPIWVTQRRALKFLEEKTEWIAAARRKMAEKYPDLAREREQAPPKAPDQTPWQAGQAPGQASRQTPDSQPGATETAAAKADRLARKCAIEALRTEAKAKLPAMTVCLAAEHGFRHGAVRIKHTKSRWGSCTARNDINLSLSLVALPEHLAEYIVLHELCHTVHKNHSARFHALLDRVTGGRSKALNKELRNYRPDVVVSVATATATAATATMVAR